MAKATRQATKPAASTEPRAIVLRWGAILGGLIAAYMLSVAFGAILAATGLAASLAVLPLVQFASLFAGGYIAGRWARVSGFMNGVAVAVAFIAVWAVLNAVYEAQLVRMNGPLALPRMNTGGVILGDLLNLSAAAFGGWVSERKGK
ncbi:MAG: hypothetical protein HY332_21090 [Chloroflexi bacterium]|nr:hypothetical protein [Chloroflexota bacterium]